MKAPPVVRLLVRWHARYFVRIMYLALLERDADDQGLSAYCAELGRSSDLISIARSIARSDEAWGKTVIGVAGSNGKTSTKDLLRAAFSRAYTIYATTGNLNNRIGVPLTLLALPPEADIAVIELGTSLPGEVAILRDIAEPDIALVTSIAEEHLEGLGDLAGVLREEAAAYEGVAVGIAPSAQPEIAEVARGKAKRVIVAGLDASADLKPDRWEIGPDGLGVIEIAGVTVRPPVRGIHNLRNAMLALAVAHECGVSYEDAAEGIAGMPQPKMRSAPTFQLVTSPFRFVLMIAVSVAPSTI